MQFDPNIFSYIKKIKKINICILFLGMQDDQKYISHIKKIKNQGNMSQTFFLFFFIKKIKINAIHIFILFLRMQ